MSNILRRPMFRKGGKVDSRGTGITSGLDDRQNYEEGGYVERYKKIREQLLADQPKLSLGEYLRIAGTGLQIAGAPSRGGGISGAFTTAAPFLGQLGTDIGTSLTQRQQKTGDTAAALLALEEESKGVSDKRFASEVKANQIRAGLNAIAVLKEQLNKAKTEDEKNVIKRKIAVEERILENLYGKDPVLAAIIKSSPELVQDFIDDYREKNKKNPSVAEIKEYLKGRSNFADGGLAATEPKMTAAPSDSPVQNLSYEELRARLPQEITNDIVRLVADSNEALVDFANIRTQQDVDNFNRKYQVNLVLPQES